MVIRLHVVPRHSQSPMFGSLMCLTDRAVTLHAHIQRSMEAPKCQNWQNNTWCFIQSAGQRLISDHRQGQNNQHSFQSRYFADKTTAGKLKFVDTRIHFSAFSCNYFVKFWALDGTTELSLSPIRHASGEQLRVKSMEAYQWQNKSRVGWILSLLTYLICSDQMKAHLWCTLPGQI